MARRHGIESRYISAAELSDYTAAHGYCAGVFNPDIHGIHPAKLLHEMVRLADEAGVFLGSHSPVLGVERHAASFQIKLNIPPLQQSMSSAQAMPIQIRGCHGCAAVSSLSSLRLSQPKIWGLIRLNH